jgi:hypothetical protein
MKTSMLTKTIETLRKPKTLAMIVSAVIISASANSFAVNQAENFDNSTGHIEIANGASGQFIRFFESNDIAVYHSVDFGSNPQSLTVNIAQAFGEATGASHIDFRIGSASGQLVARLAVADTGSWHNFVTQSTPLWDVSGVHDLYMLANHPIGAGDVDWFTVNAGASSDGKQVPFSGSTLHIPRTIQAENYDLGGEGIAFHDTTTGNEGGDYRSDNVDIQTATVGDFNVGWVTEGEWMEYTTFSESGGNFMLKALVASQSTGGRLHFEVSGATTLTSSSVSFDSTGAWQNWQETHTTSITLNPGTNVIRTVIDSGTFNLNSFTVSAGGDGSDNGWQTPLGSTAHIPSTIEAEDYDQGGEGVAYHDESSGNAGGDYRVEDVDIQAASTGGYNVGWISAGEWMEYTTFSESGGTFYLSAMVASPLNGGSLHFEVSGASTRTSAKIFFAGTGGWQNWENTTSTPVTLNPGKNVIRVVVDSGRFNINSFKAAGANGSF